MSLENRFQILGHVLPVKCDTTAPQTAKSITAQPISDSQILLVWTSQFGPGYRYRISINMSDVFIRQIEGPMGYGNIGAVVVNGLLPSMKYGFAIQHECEDKPKMYSIPKNKTATTLDLGKVFYRRESIIWRDDCSHFQYISFKGFIMKRNAVTLQTDTNSWKQTP